MSKCITRIEVNGFYNRFDIAHDFQSGINIIHGLNGTGKTTLIHIIANLINGDYYRFLYIPFFKIEAWFNDGNKVVIKNNDFSTLPEYSQPEHSIRICINDDRRGILINERYADFENEKILDQEQASAILLKTYTVNKVILPSAYFPAFRTMIEAWKTADTNSGEAFLSKSTNLSRKLFGQFTPSLNYPTPVDIENAINNEIQEIEKEILNIDKELMSQMYIDTLYIFSIDYPITQAKDNNSIIENIESIFEEILKYPIYINSLSATKIYYKIKDLLTSNSFNVNSSEFIKSLSFFTEVLKKIEESLRKKFADMERYLSSVNDFLENKKLEVSKDMFNTKNTFIQVKFNDNSIISGLGALSSGERQVATMLYAATHMSQEQVVLIDEPEISLHIDWQRLLLKKMSEQLPNPQIIVCTHSPFIAEEYADNLKELELKVSDKYSWIYQDEQNHEDNNDDEIFNE
ncbi:AAA family ATPase [Nostoc sp. 'Peltigera membranacea cyanobiont' N6]|uniref:AAA family ATPase n=1 Tax=Nostoc sp. 'Peltigera membranacea cyanobiont' N6 TaxID=1261031 RepID=UPI000CF3573B|nr:AAA family ATPase [Nostoc sp. 'Peltigera membranacea cyanobiont' N6]AVH61968.1 AAA ATPase [Nostoc sp. 'Peltigera membranacea cyanobiont' N6]